MIVLLAWSNSFGLGFARDGGEVTSDLRIQAATAENVNLILGKHYWWPNPADRLYRPVTTLSYWLNYSALGGGTNPAGYHVLNVLLHLVNVWLVFALAIRLLRNREQAFCAAAIWAVHPITTESVSNVAGRADLLATTALLSGLLLYSRARSGWRSGVALFAIAVVGVFSKETGAVLLGLILLWDIAFGFDKRKLPLYGAVVASLVLMAFVRWRIFIGEPWPERAFPDNPLIGAGFWTARFTAVKAVGMELGLMVFPLRLSSDYSFDQIPLAHANDGIAWVALAAIVAILALAVVSYRRSDRVLFWCAGFTGLTLLPASNLIVPIGATMSERFLYLPSIGVAIAIAALIFRIKDGRVGFALIAAIVVVFAVRTFLRNPDWYNDLTISTADVKAAPASFRPHELRARRLYAESPEGNLDEAIREDEAAWAILRPLPPVDSDQRTPSRLGALYRKKGEYQKSLDVLLRAREISRAREKAFDDAQLAHGLPLTYRLADDVLYFNLAGTYSDLGKLPEALDALRYERILSPEAPDSYDAMARVYIKRGDFASAAVALDERALTSGPTADTVSTLREVYSHLPEGSCAFKTDGTGLNPECPGVLQHRCAALSDLAQVFRDARIPDMAARFNGLAGQQGCHSP